MTDDAHKKKKKKRKEKKPVTSHFIFLTRLTTYLPISATDAHYY